MPTVNAHFEMSDSSNPILGHKSVSEASAGLWSRSGNKGSPSQEPGSTLTASIGTGPKKVTDIFRSNTSATSTPSRVKSSRINAATLGFKPFASSSKSTTDDKQSAGDLVGDNTYNSPSKRSRGHGSHESLRSPVNKDIFNSQSVREATSVTSFGETKRSFNDPVHGGIEFDGLTLRIIDTFEFQRLDKLKQLGTCCYVFRGATHTRFSHSLGVSHLARKVVETFRTNQPELGITDADVECVRTAALCHDLGHGPFSHVYDGVFIRDMFPDGIDDHGGHWKHEDGSVNMLRYILEKNRISVEDFGLTETEDLLFIEEVIGGVPESKRKGRSPNKFFLYDIVNNTRNGLDVDKLDYYRRDMMFSNVILKDNFDRFISYGRVLPAEPIDHINTLSPGEYPFMICYPEKLVNEAIEVFSVRFRMHSMVYTHKSVKSIEFMITDALKMADPFLQFQGRKSDRFPEGLYKMSECIFDPEALSNLNDSCLETILYLKDPGLQPAKELLMRVYNRDLYSCLGRSTFERGDPIDGMSEASILQEIVSISQALVSGQSEYALSQNHDDEQAPRFDDLVAFPSDGADFSRLSQLSQLPSLEVEDLIVEKMHLHYGLKQKNPVERMRFFAKHGGIGKAITEKAYDSSLPRRFEDKAVRLFCRHEDKEKIAHKAFEIWCKRRKTHVPFPTSQGDEDLWGSSGGNNEVCAMFSP